MPTTQRYRKTLPPTNRNLLALRGSTANKAHA
jgi:hypothetical protein